MDKQNDLEIMDGDFTVKDFIAEKAWYECERCGIEGKYIERTIGWYDDEEHMVAEYYVCPKCGYDWTAYLGEFEGYIMSFEGWCDHNC